MPPPSKALQLGDPEWPEIERLISEAKTLCNDLGISLSVRRRGEKRVDPLDEIEAGSDLN